MASKRKSEAKPADTRGKIVDALMELAGERRFEDISVRDICKTAGVSLAGTWTGGLRKIERVEIVPLDVTDTESVTEQAQQNGAHIDILVNTAEHVRPGGIVDRHGLTIAREEMDVRYLGLMRLAQAFGPLLRFRGADGVNSAAAFVNHPVLKMACLTLSAMGVYASSPVFWTLAPNFLTGPSAAVGIAFINSVAALGAFVAPWLIGLIKDATGSFSYGLLMLAALVTAGGFLVLSRSSPSERSAGRPSRDR